MKKVILFLILIFIPLFVKAESLKFDWEKIWDVNGSEDVLNYIFNTDDGYVLVGRSNSTNINGVTNHGSTDVIIMKYDKDWNLVLEKNYGGNGSDYFYNVLQTKDGGFLAAAQSSSTNMGDLVNKGDTDAFLVKYDKDWNIMWQQNWGGNRKDYFSYVFETYDDCYIAFGRSQSSNLDSISKNDSYYDSIIIKYDKEGNLLWEKKWGGNRHERFTEVIQTEDKGYIAIGQTNSHDLEGISNGAKYVSVIVRFDKDGNFLSAKNWESTGNGKQSEFLSIVKTYDDCYILVARNDSSNLENIVNKGEEDIIIVKYDKNWNLLWQKNWGGNLDDIPEKIMLTRDGGFVVIGKSLSTDIEGISNFGENDGVVIKFDKDGNIIWNRNYGGPGVDIFNSFVFDDNGEDIILLCSLDVSAVEDNVEHIGKYSSIIKYSIEYAIEKVNSDNGIYVFEKKGKLGIVTPMPNDGYVVDEIVVKDSLGNIVKTIKQEDGTYTFELYSDVSVEVIFIKDFVVEEKKTINGEVEIVKRNARMGVIIPKPINNYEVDMVIIKDKLGNILDVEVTKLEDGTYSFPINEDVSIEVLFKEKNIIENPKTGVIDFITIIIVGFVVSFIGFTLVKKNCYRYEL